VNDPNPFFPPQASATPPRPVVLASPGDRIKARFVVWIIPLIPYFLLMAVLVPALTQLPEGAVTAIALVWTVPVWAWWIWQWHLLATTGQDLGKWMVGIRVVGPDGGVPGWGRVLVREVAWGILVGFLNLLCMGYLITLVDALMLTRLDRRTLHDMLAETQVVNA
jgi:uncharacterized RDD family membrane protein YckC